MENFPTVMRVVALALVNDLGRVLMHRRNESSMHGGLWEFPGGKLELGESHVDAIVRESREELGIELDKLRLIEAGEVEGSVDTGANGGAISIRLFMARTWKGEVQCLEGEEIGWFHPAQVSDLAMPPLDYPLAVQLQARLAKEAK